MGQYGESLVMSWLNRPEFDPIKPRYGCGYDIDCYGARIEVKTAVEKDGYWKFNLHRHGILNESRHDVYVLVFLGLHTPFYVVPSPIGCKVLSVHRGQLNSPKWSRLHANTNAILHYKKPARRYEMQERAATTHHSVKLQEADRKLMQKYQQKYHLTGHGGFTAAIKQMLRRIAEYEGWIN
jgi:hypothetical protein